jgi:hypothetical protein
MERSNPYEGELTPFYYPLDRLKDNPNGDYTTYCIGIKDTILINSQIYNDVAVFYVKKDVIEPAPLSGKPAKYYWAKNFGLLRKDLYEPKFSGDTNNLYHSWKLINSYIIQ